LFSIQIIKNLQENKVKATSYTQCNPINIIPKGPYKGQVIDASNNLLGKMETDKVFRNGDRVYVVLTTDGKKILSATAYDHYRLAIEFLLVILFAVLLFIFAGLGGLKVLLSLVATFIIIWKVMLPMMLKGHDPLWIAIGTVMLITGITLFLVAGVTRTAIVAWVGTFMGISLTALLAFLLFPRFRLHGAIQPFSETLLYSGFDYIDLGRLFIASIFIGASGAVADISIDVAAAMREVVQKRPEIGGVELARSGLNVGRAAASVMITTLVMAYISGYMVLLMILISKGIPAV